MNLLLDTHFVIELVEERFSIGGMVRDEDVLFVSAVNLWEIAIKHRLGKLRLGVKPTEVPALVEHGGIQIIDIDRHHVLAELNVVPPTRDPFDQLLLAQCQVEGMRLVTVDDKLVSHPLAWRP
ncbi:MAG: PIN domain-containing protein [Alphaproteobacteria bacterium]|nr:PIN domain-containing protein [Alphaproteobacteria bacterium]